MTAMTTAMDVPISNDPESKMAVPDNDTVTSQILVLARRLQGDYFKRIEETGLTASQARVLRELFFFPGLAQHQLAQHLEIGKVSTGEALTRLERAGYIYRARCEQNRRLMRVHLSNEGEQVLLKLSDAAEDQMKELDGLLGESFMQQLNEMLLTLNRAMEGTAAVSVVE